MLCLTSSATGPADGVASPLPFAGVPLLHLLRLNSVARSGARGVRCLMKIMASAQSRQIAVLAVSILLAGCCTKTLVLSEPLSSGKDGSSGLLTIRLVYEEGPQSDAQCNALNCLSLSDYELARATVKIKGQCLSEQLVLPCNDKREFQSPPLSPGCRYRISAKVAGYYTSATTVTPLRAGTNVHLALLMRSSGPGIIIDDRSLYK
jgi:hypothetical protein